MCAIGCFSSDSISHVTQRIMLFVRIYFFFFQAEDGIRDVAVTGVQTCALPIYGASWHPVGGSLNFSPGQNAETPSIIEIRSEERRVGKECRSRIATL